MSSGAPRALVAVLLTLVATIGMVVPAAAKTDALNESSSVLYEVRPNDGKIDVEMRFVLKTQGQRAFPPSEWGPIVVEDETRPSATNPFSVVDGSSRDLPGLWREIQVQTPRIEGGAQGERFVIRYTIDARVSQNDARKARTPARVDESYMYFCVPGQDTDRGSVRIDIVQTNPSSWKLTQNGTPLERTDQGLQSPDDLRRTPAQIFTCIEGVREDQLATDSFVGPEGREVVLQAWKDAPNWLQAAEARSEPVLDELHRFLGIDIPGNGPVIIRHSPRREIGGYASAHDTPGVVQLDEDGGVQEAEHQLAHAWFGTDNFVELWLREGLATWTATAMLGGSDDAACEAVTANDQGLDLSAWQIVQPASGGDVEQVAEAQEAAACGIMSAIASRLTPEQWRDVLASMLDGETKYVGSDGPEVASNPVVDHEEFLDAVDERGLVPAGYTDLDFAQDLLDEFGIAVNSAKLEQRSEARAMYHQFLADADPLGAPLAVRRAMDDWNFERAVAALDTSYVVLRAIQEANEKLPNAGLIPLIQRPFEDARDIDAIDEVRVEALSLLERATQLVTPLGELQAVTPSGWEFPAAINAAINERRFDDAMSAIAPSIDVVENVAAADAALPMAGILESFRARYESTATASLLRDLAEEAASVRGAAERTERALTDLGSVVGDWQIPPVVTELIEGGQLTAARAVILDAIDVVEAATEADIALPEAQLRSELREPFEATATAEQMRSLKTRAESRRAEATAVGNARTTLRTRVPDWQIPEVVSAPIEAGDFATAAVNAAAAQRWVTNAFDADDAWPEFGALERSQADFESAESLADLEAGADRAEAWKESATYVGRAIEEAEGDRDILTVFGLWGVDIDGPLQNAKDAALAGDVPGAINWSSEVISRVSNGTRDGSLRLAGLVFLGIAVLGVLGLWVMLRRQRGPSWARESTPHWIEDKKALPWRRAKRK